MQHRSTRRVADRRAPELRRALRLAVLALPLAASVAAAPSVHAQPQAQAVRRYDIPAGPLAATLGRLGMEAGALLSFSMAQTDGRRSPGVRGELSVPQALAAVLAGTGLQAVPEGTGWRLQPVPQRGGEAGGEGVATLATVQVRADAAADRTSPLALRRSVAAGALGSRAQLDTPFSTTVVTSEQLEERQIASVTDAFALDPSVTNEAASYTIWATQLSVRGLGLDQASGLKVNGLPVYQNGLDIPYDHLERIELFKGATGFMNGFGAPGGIANFVTRRPGEEAVRSIDVGYRSSSVRLVHADLGSRFRPDDRFGWRINATREEGSTYNDGKLRRSSLTLGLGARLTSNLSWSLDLVHQERYSTGESSALSISQYRGKTLPRPISGKEARYAISGIYNDNSLTLVSTGLEYRFNADWKLSAKVGRSDVTTAYVKDFLSLRNAAGDYDANLLAQKAKGEYALGQALMEGHFRTGEVSHHVVLGAERQRLHFNTSRNGFYRSAGAANIYVPTSLAYVGDIDWQMRLGTQYEQTAAFVSDTLTLGNWSAIVGVRYNDYEQTGYNATGAVSSSYKKSGTLTPTLALLYKPVEHATLYASYVESLESGGVVAQQYVNANDVLKPLKSKQYEAGFKAEAGVWTTTGALFRIERAAAYANASNYYVQEGLAVFQGAEFNTSVRLGRAWTLGGGLMFLEPEYRRGTTFDGNRVVTTPRVVTTAYARYDVPQVPGLGLHTNAKYIGDTYADAANAIRIGGRTVIGMGASYQSRIGGLPVTWRAEVTNLANRKAWVASGSSQVLPLLPRTFALNAKVDF